MSCNHVIQVGTMADAQASDARLILEPVTSLSCDVACPVHS